MIERTKGDTLPNPNIRTGFRKFAATATIAAIALSGCKTETSSASQVEQDPTSYSDTATPGETGGTETSNPDVEVIDDNLDAEPTYEDLYKSLVLSQNEYPTAKDAATEGLANTLNRIVETPLLDEKGEISDREFYEKDYRRAITDAVTSDMQLTPNKTQYPAEDFFNAFTGLSASLQNLKNEYGFDGEFTITGTRYGQKITSNLTEEAIAIIVDVEYTSSNIDELYPNELGRSAFIKDGFSVQVIAGLGEDNNWRFTSLRHDL